MTGHAETSAVIYVRDGEYSRRSLAACLDYCERHGYTLTSMVMDPDGTGWRSLIGACEASHATVVVIAERGELPVGRSPRLEVVAEERPPPLGRITPLSRRPQPA